MKHLLLLFTLCVVFLTTKADLVIVNKDKVNVRDGASTAARVLGKVSSGACFNDFETAGDWFKINYNGKTAYISKTVAVLLESSPVTNHALRSGYETMFPLDGIRHSGYMLFTPADKGYVVMEKVYMRYSEDMGELPAEPHTYIGRVIDGKYVAEYSYYGYIETDAKTGKCAVDGLLKDAEKLGEPVVCEYDGNRNLFWDGEMLFKTGEDGGDESKFPGDAKALFDSAAELKKEETAKKPKADKVVAEVEPQFRGGTAALLRYLSSNLRYPAVAAENGVQGKVFLKLTVEADGSISDVTVVRGVSPDLDREAVRVVKSMTGWIPATLKGKPVRAYMTLPVIFRLS